MQWELLLALGIGVVSGFLNTLASGGSAVALPLLIGLGMPPAVANATNRLPVLFAYASATLTFRRAGLYDRAIVQRVLPPTLAGGALGALLAEYVTRDELTIVINAALLVSLVLLFTTLKQTLTKVFSDPPRYRWQDAVWLFLVGAWLGLIVIDGATYLLLVLILGMHLPMAQANACKALVGLAINVLAVAVFARSGHVDWVPGLALALGSLGGGYLGARASLQPWARTWTYRLLMVVMVLELLHMAIQYWHHAVLPG